MSSPFNVFRKYQKAFLVVAGCILMFVFVIGDSLTQMVGGGGSGSQTVGGRNPSATAVTFRGGDLSNREVSQLVFRRQVLKTFLDQVFQIGARALYQAGGDPQSPIAVEPVARNDRRETGVENDVVRTKLMADAAVDAGMTISDDQIRHYLTELGRGRVSTDQMRQIAKRIQSSSPVVSIDFLFDALRTELLARNYVASYQMAFATATPTQRWEDWLRVNQRLAIEAVALPASQWVVEVDDPTDAELEEFFVAYRERDPLPVVEANTELPSPDPGFASPHRVRFQFLRADFNKRLSINAEKVTEEEVKEYYEANKDPEFIKASTDIFGDLEGLEEAPAEEPATEEPATEEPATEEPATEEPATEEPATEEPATEEPATEEPATEEPATEEPATEEPATEEPATEEPATEEPATEEPATEEPATEEPATEEPATEEPATEEPATEEPATEEPATEEPATEEPATEEPATEEPATEQSSSTVPAIQSSQLIVRGQSPDDESDVSLSAEAEAEAEAALEETTNEEPPKEFQSLDDVRDVIRNKLAAQKTAAELQTLMGNLAAELSQAHSSWLSRVFDAQAVDPEAETPPAPPELTDLTGLAEKHELDIERTGILSYLDFRNTPLGKSQESQKYRSPLSTVMFAADDRGESITSLYEPVVSYDLDGNYFLTLKIEDYPRKIPELEEIREEVVAAWKRRKAGELALKKAEELASSVDGTAGALGENLSSEIDSLGLQVVTTDQFSWLTVGDVAPTTGQVFFRLNQPSSIEAAGPEFMRTVFRLQDGQVEAVSNHDDSIAYVVRIAERAASTDQLRQDYLAEADRWFGLSSMASLHRMQAAQSFVRDFVESNAIDWQRPADALVE